MRDDFSAGGFDDLDDALGGRSGCERDAVGEEAREFAARVLRTVAMVVAAENRIMTAAMPVNFARKKTTQSTGLLKMADAVPWRISPESAAQAA